MLLSVEVFNCKLDAVEYDAGTQQDANSNESIYYITVGTSWSIFVYHALGPKQEK